MSSFSWGRNADENWAFAPDKGFLSISLSTLLSTNIRSCIFPHFILVDNNNSPFFLTIIWNSGGV